MLWCDFGVMFDFGFANMFFYGHILDNFYHKDILIGTTDYFVFFYQIVLYPLTTRLPLRNFTFS